LGAFVALFLVVETVAEKVDRLPALAVDDAQSLAAPDGATPRLPGRTISSRIILLASAWRTSLVMALAEGMRGAPVLHDLGGTRDPDVERPHVVDELLELRTRDGRPLACGCMVRNRPP